MKSERGDFSSSPSPLWPPVNFSESATEPGGSYGRHFEGVLETQKKGGIVSFS